MSAKNPLHAATTLCAFDYLKRWRSPPQASLVEVALVRVQNPIQLSQYSEPEPDIAKILLLHSPTGHNTPISRHPTDNCNFFCLILDSFQWYILVYIQRVEKSIVRDRVS